MKKIYVLFFSIVFFVTGNLFAQNLTLSTTSASSSAGGGNFSIFVYLDSDVDLTTLGFKVNVSNWAGSGISIVEYKKAGRASADPQSGGIDNTNGSVTISIGSLSGSSAVGSGSGPIVEIVFSSSSSSPAGTHKLSISNINNFYTTSFQDVTGAVNEGTQGSITITTPAAPEIDVGEFNTMTSISDGDMTPSLSDGTDFGNVDVDGGKAETLFYIQNTGDGDLLLTGSPIVQISGANASDFTVTMEPASVLPGSSLDLFSIKFDPSAPGLRQAVISIANSDADENPYNFAIQGTGISNKISITIDSNPEGLLISVDGSNYTAPHIFQWNKGDSHTIAVASPQSGGAGTQYVYTSWSDGGDQSHTYTVPGSDATVTANFKKQYQLTVNSAHGSPTGAGWYDVGASAAFGVTTPESGGAGTRYVFTDWTGTGTGSYTGADASSTVTMNNPVTEDASWKTQYYLTTAENPDAGGDMTPAPPGAWYDSGTDASLDATVNTGYQWAGWSGDLSGTTKPTTITMDAPKSVTANFGKQVQITVTTDPVGRDFVVDGTTYSSAQTFSWDESSTHIISVTSPQSGGAGTQYVYTSWSDGGDQSHIYTVPGTNQTVTANFKTQYELTVNSAHGSPTGAGWYDEGASATFGVTTPESGGAGTRYVFTDWTGTGTGSYTGTDVSSTVTMNNPITEDASWKTQYELTVNSAHGSPTGAGWYDKGASTTFGVTTPESGGAGTRYVFTDWTGTGTGSYTGTDASYTVTMNNPITEDANWKTQYYLTTAENPDEGGDISPAPPGKWYDSGTDADVVATPANGYMFHSWSEDLSGNTNPTQISMGSSHSVVANFVKIVQITINTDPAGLKFTVDGQEYVTSHTFNWGEGTEHNISTQSPQNGPNNKTFVFKNWSDGGSISHKYITPKSPETVTVHFVEKQNAILTMQVNLSAWGKTVPEVGTHNFSIGDVVQISAIPFTGFRFDHWEGSVQDAKNPQTTVTMDGDKVVKAYFRQEYYNLNLSVAPSNGGNTEPAVGTHQYKSWTNVSIHAIPNSGYRFLNWSGDVENPDSSSTNVLMLSDKNIVANFELIPTKKFTLMLNVNPESAGTTVPAAGQVHNYDAGEQVSLIAIPTNGYVFSNWTGDVADAQDSMTTIKMDTNKIVTANFKKVLAVKVQTEPTGLKVQVDGTEYTSPHEFQWVMGSQHEVSALSPQSGGAGKRYVYDSWSDGGTQTHEITVASSSIYTAHYKTEYELSVGREPAEGGVVEVTPSAEWYESGEEVTLTARADTSLGYVFSGWSGSITSAENPVGVVMDGSKNIVANFVKRGHVRIATEPSGLKVQVDGTEYTSPHDFQWVMGSQHNISAISPQSGAAGVRYEYDSWSDGGTQTHEITIGSNNIFTAHYKTEYELTLGQAPAEGGSVEAMPPGPWYVNGTEVMLTAKPDTNLGYAFSGWSGSITSVENPVSVMMERPKSVIAHFKEIQEAVSTPNRPSGPTGGKVGQSLDFSTGGASSNLGHSVEYEFDWGDGSTSSWGSANRSHTYSSASTFDVKARARCSSHTSVVSSWSSSKAVSISYCQLSVSVTPSGSGSVSKNPDKSNFSWNENVQLTANADSGYEFDYWSGDLSGSTNPKSLNMNGDKSVTAFFKVVAQNSAPSKPTLVSLDNNSFTMDSDPELRWNVPSDVDGDLLHFRVEIATDGSLSSHVTGSPFESMNNADGFAPTPPVAQGNGTCSFTALQPLADGEYWWRVTAWDGKAYGAASDTWKFTIDTEKPYTAEHSPADSATDVPVNSSIVVHIRDGSSGVDTSSISMKVNQMEVQPIITGSLQNITLTYAPRDSFYYDSRVTVIVAAKDRAGNEMDTDYYSFFTEKKTQKPAFISTVVHKHGLHEPFGVDIELSEVKNLFGLSFVFKYPDALLEYHSVQPADFLGPDVVFIPLPAGNGTLPIAITQKAGQPGASGTGVVVRVTMQEKPGITSGTNIAFSFTEIVAIDAAGNAITLTAKDTSYVTPNPTWVEEIKNQVPDDYVLYPNYPNPFNPTTTISFALPQAAKVQIQIFDVTGREIKRLVDQVFDAGVHSVVWNGTDKTQQKLSSGIYICRFSAGEVVINRKLILAK